MVSPQSPLHAGSTARTLRNNGISTTHLGRNYTPPSNQDPLKDNSYFVSYKAPLGQVASLDLGQQISVNGQCIKVLEKTIFKPILDEKWDGTDNQFNFKKENISVESLRKLIELLTEPEIEELDEEEALKAHKEAEELDKLLKLEKARQQSSRIAIRQKLELIDRPVLDQHQDKIFRLPLGSQIILTGAPGTGKTTALVIGLTRAAEFLGITYNGRFPSRLRAVQEEFHTSDWNDYISV